MQKLGIKRQDHAQRIVKHITAKFDQDLYSRLQEFEGLYVPDSRGGLVTTTPLTLCVEGNISAGKSTFLQYITNNNEELQQQLGVSGAWQCAAADRTATAFWTPVMACRLARSLQVTKPQAFMDLL